MEKLYYEGKDINYKKYAIDQNWKKLQKKDDWLIFNENLGFQKPDYSNIEKKHIDYKNILY